MKNSMRILWGAQQKKKKLRGRSTGIYKSLQRLVCTFTDSLDYYESRKIFKINSRKLDKWDLYYDAMENLNSGRERTAESLLKKALEVDNSFVAAHVGLVAVYEKPGEPHCFRTIYVREDTLNPFEFSVKTYNFLSQISICFPQYSSDDLTREIECKNRTEMIYFLTKKIN